MFNRVPPARPKADGDMQRIASTSGATISNTLVGGFRFCQWTKYTRKIMPAIYFLTAMIIPVAQCCFVMIKSPLFSKYFTKSVAFS